MGWRWTSVVLLLAAVGGWCSAAPAHAAGDSGAGAPAAGSASGVAAAPRYRPPVDAPVADPFRRPQHRYGPGNRGLEYAVSPGAPVRSIGPGVVAHAGAVAGRLVVSVVHPDGLRSAVTGLATIRVRVGDRVGTGSVLGTARPGLHLGVRRGGEYLDPAELFASATPARSVLVAPR